MSVSSEVFSRKVLWLIFLLANKFSTSLTIAKDFEGKEEILAKELQKTGTCSMEKAFQM